MKKKSQNPARQSGFSGIELLVVMGIIAIAAAMAIPGFALWLPNYHLKAAARDLYSNLQLARLIAVKRNAACAVIFDQGVSPGRYFICSNPGANGAWDGPPVVGGDDVVQKMVTLSDYGRRVDYGGGGATDDIAGTGALPGDPITYAAPDDIAVFTSNGMVVNPGVSGSYVYLCNSRGSSYGVGTPALAGAIVLKQWGGNGWE